MAEITEEVFNSLRSRQRVFIAANTGWQAGGEMEFEVGRKSYSKKYDVYSLRLYPVQDGEVIKRGRAKWHLYSRSNSPGTGRYISLAHGNMGAVMKSFRIASLRSAVIRLASPLPEGSQDRKVLLDLLTPSP